MDHGSWVRRQTAMTHVPCSINISARFQDTVFSRAAIGSDGNERAASRRGRRIKQARSEAAANQAPGLDFDPLDDIVWPFGGRTLAFELPGARRLRAGVALGPRQPRLAIVELGSGKPIVRILGELPEGAAAVARDAVRRIGCSRAIVAPAPTQTEVFLAARGALRDSEFESMLVLEVGKFELPFAPEDTALASEVRARPNNGQVTVGAASRAGVDAALGVASDLGLDARAVVPDSLAYEAILKACGLGEPGRATLVIDVGPDAVVFHAF